MIAKRQSPRKSPERIVCLQMEPNNHAIVLNISDQGLGFRALKPVTQSGTIRFMFLENGQQIEANGELVWIDSRKTTGGLSLASLPQASRERFRTWVDEAAMHISKEKASEPAAQQSSEYPRPNVGQQESSAPPSPSFTRPSIPYPPPVTPGFVLLGDNSQYTDYALDQASVYADPPSKFFRGLLTGVLISAILAAIAVFHYDNLRAVLPTLLGAGTNVSPAAPPASAPPLSAASGSVSSQPAEAAAAETTAASGHLPDSADNSSANGAATQTVTQPPPIGSQFTQASEAALPNTADTGEAELALAQRYLNGKTGPASRAAAVAILWTAVKKGNVTAEITLADLYARGDGVSKSCEQSRVLLRAAAGKGGSEASQELANIIRRSCP